MPNSHYVPMLTLRKFADKICVFNVQTGEYKENIKIEKLFSEQDFYSNEIERKLNERIESQFGNLFSNKLLNAEGTIELKRDELQIIKKFLLISVIRSMGSEKIMQTERKFYDNLKEHLLKVDKENALSDEEIKTRNIEPPFKERVIEGETPFEYWMRTLNVILDSNGTPEDILKHPNKTYPAYRWAEVINNGYIAFWDSEYVHDEYIITDVGMTSENEKGWNGITVHNLKKAKFLMEVFEKEKNLNHKIEIARWMHLHRNFSENFMMFPISAKRMIVEIDPFYKFRIFAKSFYNMPKLDYLTKLDNENLYYPNSNKYILPQDGISPKYHPDDLYIYEIKKLTSKETRYCNELFLDRINTLVGFTSLNKAVGSIVQYKRTNSYPYVPRVDYTELYKIINERYDSSIDINTIGGFRR